MPLNLHRPMKDCTVPDPHLRFWLSPSGVGINGQGCFGMGYPMVALATKFFNGGGWKVDSFASDRNGKYWDTNVGKGQTTGTFGYKSGSTRFQHKISDASGKGGLDSHSSELVYDIDNNMRVLASVKGGYAALSPQINAWSAAFKLKQSNFSTEVSLDGKGLGGAPDSISAYVMGEPVGKDLMVGAYANLSGAGVPNYFDIAALAAVPFGGKPIMVRAGTHLSGSFKPNNSLDLMVLPPAQDVAGFKVHPLLRVQQGGQRAGKSGGRAVSAIAHIEEVLPEMDAKVKVDMDLAGGGGPTLGLAGMWVKGGNSKAPGSWLVNFSLENILGKGDIKYGMRIIQGGTPPPL